MIARALFLVLLQLYPASFRRRHGAEMWEVCQDRLASARRARGPAGAAAVWRHEVADHLRAATRERAYARRLRRAADPAVGASRSLSAMVSAFVQDVRFGARQLVRRPGFTLVAVATLALGIGATTAVFTVVNGVLLRPLAFADPDRVVQLHRTTSSGARASISPLDYLDYRDELTSFSRVAAIQNARRNLTGSGEPERLLGALVTADFFPLLGVRPALGTTWPDDGPGEDHVVVLAWGVWQRAFGGDPSIIGRRVMLHDEPYTVIGVMPAWFRYPTAAEFWIPLRFEPDDLTPNQRGAQYLQAIGRLRPDADLAAAQAELAALSDRQRAAYPRQYDAHTAAGATPVLDTLVENVRPALLVLLGAVALVLLIACANVANLLLVRAAGRRTELAVRASLGAGRSRLGRQLVTESLLLALAGGALGVALASWGVRLLLALDSAGLPRADAVHLDWRVVAFTAAVAAATGVAFGVAPAFQATRPSLADSLRQGARDVAAGARRFRHGLVVAEIALALVLLAGAGLLMRSFLNLQQVEPGFDPRGVLTFNLYLPDAAYGTAEEVSGFYNRMFDALEALPGAERAGMIFGLPLGRYNGSSTFSIDGRPDPETGDNYAMVRVVGGRYFEAMRIPIRRGRTFTRTDAVKAPLVALINEATARRYWPDTDPVGQRLRLHASFVEGRFGFREIVGVVGNVKQRGLEEDAQPEVYIPFAQQAVGFGTVVVRAAGDPAALAGPVRETIRGLDPMLPLADVESMTGVVSDSIARDRFTTALLSVFALLAVTLALVGVYGVTSFTVSQRTREIGVRMALGADRADVLRLVASNSLALGVAGVLIGLAGALAASRLLSGLLFGVSATDPLTLGAVAAALVAAALAASYFPARRAAHVDPLVALRDE